MRCTTFDEVLQSNQPTLGEMCERGENNISFVCTYISAGIISYLDFVGRKNTMNDRQVAETADLIRTEYPTLQFDDIALFIRMCKLAHFGKLYDITAISLLEWITMYVNERKIAKNNMYDRLQKEQEKERRERSEAEYRSMSDVEKEKIRQGMKDLINKTATEFGINKPKDL